MPVKNPQDNYYLRTLKVYLYYRVALAGLLYVMYEANLTRNTFGEYHPNLFSWASLGYLVVALISLVYLFDKHVFSSNRKILALLISDVCALMLMVHASGGVTSGLGYLLVIMTAIASMFLQRRLSLAFAAFVTIALLTDTFFVSNEKGLARSLFASGSVGFLVFLTAITFQFLTERIQASTQEALEKSAYARQIVQLAEHIVARMRTGIIVINEKNTIELMNEAALQMLNLDHSYQYFGKDITHISNLKSIIQQWRENLVSGMALVHEITNNREVRINFAKLDGLNQGLTILYLEDYANLVQQAHQLKLASLGRLTASIAHEIRNPLGAISHASQLLSESNQLNEGDAKFLDIILRHTDRVNSIIENTMSLSKRKEPKAEQLTLNNWIPAFIDEYKTDKSCAIDMRLPKEDITIKMDPSHLRQVLTNLFDNGLRYSMENTGSATLLVDIDQSRFDETRYIDIIDDGVGVPEEKIETVFEPFFTTGKEGTGLGLYISRELCEINQATLSYRRADHNKSCFRIKFPHHERMI